MKAFLFLCFWVYICNSTQNDIKTAYSVISDEVAYNTESHASQAQSDIVSKPGSGYLKPNKVSALKATQNETQVSAGVKNSRLLFSDLIDDQTILTSLTLQQVDQKDNPKKSFNLKTNNNASTSKILSKIQNTQAPTAPTAPTATPAPTVAPIATPAPAATPTAAPTATAGTPAVLPEPEEVIVYNNTEPNLFFGPTQEDTTSNDDNDGEFISKKNTEILTVLLCAIMVLLLVLIISLKDLISSHLKPFVSKRLRYVSRDVLIIMFIITIILWLDFKGVDTFGCNISGIGLFWSIAALTWFAYSIILVCFAHLYSTKLEEKENKLVDQDDILDNFRNLSSKTQRNASFSLKEHSLLTKYEDDLTYFLLRQNFICPSHLPPVTEGFLRRDFNFAGYLTLCLEKVLDQVLGVSVFTFLSILIVCLFWLLLMQSTAVMMGFILFSAPIPILAIISLIIKLKFGEIERQLRTLIRNPQDIYLVPITGQVEPFGNSKNSPPLYLSQSVSNTEIAGEKTQAYNLHERLFWFSSPKIWLTVVHMLIMMQLTWSMIFYGYYFGRYHTTVEIVINTFSTVVLLANLLLIIPSSITCYTIITNIEMMRDKELIKTTVLNQRQKLHSSLIKLYRALKAIKRKRNLLDPEENQTRPLKGFYINTIEEAINQINPNDWEFKGADLPALAHLCGNRLEKDELMTLARETGFVGHYDMDDQETSFIDKFILSIEQRTQDVKNEPYQTSYEVLTHIVPLSESITADQLSDYMNNNDVVMPKEDLDNISHEMKYLGSKENFDLLDLSALVRNGIEQYAR